MAITIENYTLANVALGPSRYGCNCGEPLEVSEQNEIDIADGKVPLCPVCYRLNRWILGAHGTETYEQAMKHDGP